MDPMSGYLHRRYKAPSENILGKAFLPDQTIISPGSIRKSILIFNLVKTGLVRYVVLCAVTAIACLGLAFVSVRPRADNPILSRRA